MLRTTTLKFRAQVNEVYRTFDTLTEADKWIEACSNVPNYVEIFGETGQDKYLYANIWPIIDGVLRGDNARILRGKYITIFVDSYSPNGILLIVPTKEYQEWQSNFAAMDTGTIDFVAMEENFTDAFEDIWTNSQLKYQYDYDWSPTFEYESNENVWYYNDYMIESFTEAIYTDGFALFTKYQD